MFKRKKRETVIVHAIEWVTHEFGSEQAAQAHANIVEAQADEIGLVAGPFVSGPFGTPPSERWLVEWTETPI